MKVVVRKAVVEDFDELDRLYFELNPNRVSSRDVMADAVNSPGHHFVVVEECSDEAGGQRSIVGTMCMTEILLPSRGREAYINDLIITAHARRNGYAMLLFDEIEREAKRRGCTRAKFTSVSKRKAAHAVFFKRGYVIRASAVGETDTNLFELKLDT